MMNDRSRFLFPLLMLALLLPAMHAADGASPAPRVKHAKRVPAVNAFEPYVQSMNDVAARMDNKTATTKVSQYFRTFIVSPKNIEEVLHGLQQGRAIALTDPAYGNPMRFQPLTGPTSLGDAFVALGLARLNLLRYEILQPTYHQLYKALHGGTFTLKRLAGSRQVRLAGILRQRARGQSWDAIAQRIHVKTELMRYEMQAATVAMLERQTTTVSTNQRAPGPSSTVPQ